MTKTQPDEINNLLYSPIRLPVHEGLQNGSSLILVALPRLFRDLQAGDIKAFKLDEAKLVTALANDQVRTFRQHQVPY